ncbi:PadR family transcriptional regulator [Bacillus wiedmannii]|uniref:PadR family transcriptional regulator n=1 Tax=Bacillus wiedmannii TaxID=1890302 RepID=UPI000BF1C858|nr:PadR family transcriptional regulator [Bacillus wiedmannii]PEK57861.1 PadR family transcriptional regulator [Bacillus wiedmannii]
MKTLNGIDDKWIVQLRKGVFELVILTLLKSQSMYGYEISKKLKEVPVLSISEGAIYPILKRISNKGWIDSYWDESLDGPRRKYYKITDEGMGILVNRLEKYKEIYDVLILFGGGIDNHEKG